MITKERLEQLIKEGATIWYYEYEPFIAGYSNIIHICSVNLSSDCSIKNNTLYDAQVISFEDHNYDVLIGKLTDLFETRKEAEWHLKHHATRTEELDLPTFDDLTEIDFIAKNGDKYHLFNQDGMLVLYNRNKGSEFFKEMTKENYIEACDLCLKLFKGEEE